MEDLNSETETNIASSKEINSSTTINNIINNGQENINEKFYIINYQLIMAKKT